MENYRGVSYVTAKLRVFISEPAVYAHTFLGRGQFHKGLELGVFNPRWPTWRREEK